ncbi:unnamed protein product [Urochloa humidicola]
MASMAVAKVCVLMALLCAGVGLGADDGGGMGLSSPPNYNDALSKAILFFEGQRSGRLPASQRVKWRGNSAVHDGQAERVNLTGGYYDAGDNVKFVGIMPYSQSDWRPIRILIHEGLGLLMGLQGGNPLVRPISTSGTTPSISPVLLMNEGVGGFPPYICGARAKGEDNLLSPPLSPSRAASTVAPLSRRAPRCWHTNARRSFLARVDTSEVLRL